MNNPIVTCTSRDEIMDSHAPFQIFCCGRAQVCEYEVSCTEWFPGLVQGDFTYLCKRCVQLVSCSLNDSIVIIKRGMRLISRGGAISKCPPHWLYYNLRAYNSLKQV